MLLAGALLLSSKAGSFNGAFGPTAIPLPIADACAWSISTRASGVGTRRRTSCSTPEGDDAGGGAAESANAWRSCLQSCRVEPVGAGTLRTCVSSVSSRSRTRAPEE